MSIWVLIYVIAELNRTLTTHSVEFTSKDKCVQALDAIKGMAGGETVVNAWCFEK